jgi:hypothetical protein
VPNGHDFYSIYPNAVDNSVLAFKHFANVRPAIPWYESAGIRGNRRQIRSLDEPDGKVIGVAGLILCNVVVNLLQAPLRVPRPCGFHRNPSVKF